MLHVDNNKAEVTQQKHIKRFEWPATSNATAKRVAGILPTGAATSAGPMAPQAKETKMAEQDHTACAVARPALGIATKLKSAAKTKRTPPNAPGRVKTKFRLKINGTNNEDKKTPTQTRPLNTTGSRAGPLGIR